MDEKIVDFMLKSSRATDACLTGVETALDALIKQGKMNRRQRILNVAFVIFAWATIKHITNQNEQIKKLTGLVKQTNEKGE